MGFRRRAIISAFERTLALRTSRLQQRGSRERQGFTIQERQSWNTGVDFRRTALGLELHLRSTSCLQSWKRVVLQLSAAAIECSDFRLPGSHALEETERSTSAAPARLLPGVALPG